MLSRSLRHVVGSIALVVAILLTTGVPLGYLALQLHTRHEVLTFKAEFTASRVSRFAYLQPDLWQYQSARIGDAITLSGINPVRQTVRDLEGVVVVEQGKPLREPTIEVTSPVLVNGLPVGNVTLTASIHPILIKTLLVTGLSMVLGALAYCAVRYLPLRALDRTVDALARERTRFALALDNMGQGLCMLDTDRRLVVVSRRMAEMFGLPDTVSLHGMHATTFQDVLTRQLMPGEAFPADLLDAPPVGQDSPERMLRLTDHRILSATSRATADGLLVMTFDDVTDLLRAQAAQADAQLMRERERAAQETSKAKSMFLATMSHEIRTPMNAVLGLATSLLDTPLSEEQRHQVMTIHDSGDSLLRILNDILDYSKLEAGKLVFESMTFSPATLGETARSILGPRAAAKGLTFDVTSAANLPDAVTGDAGRLRQVILNLVSNAVKFTEAGTVTVETTCVPLPDRKARLRWCVRDTGIGIPAERLPELFAEFVQADGSINRRFGGSGLGLAICRRIVEQMGGAITVESRLGSGSVFAFEITLPVTEGRGTARLADQSDPAAALREMIARQAKPPRILVAEDNVTNQFVIRQMLKGFDIRLEMAANGAEAVAAVTRETFDLIFMDMQMPDVDGLAATRMIRAKGGWFATVPIVALTGNAFDDDQRACLDAGMNAFIAKPINKTLMLATMLRLWERGDIKSQELLPGAA